MSESIPISFSRIIIIQNLLKSCKVVLIAKIKNFDRQNDGCRTQIWRYLSLKCVFLQSKTSFLAIGSAVLLKKMQSV